MAKVCEACADWKINSGNRFQRRSLQSRKLRGNKDTEKWRPCAAADEHQLVLRTLQEQQLALKSFYVIS